MPVENPTVPPVKMTSSEQTIDFGPVLMGELYGPLRDPEVFGRVRLDTEVHALVWPNGADFDPATLHEWPAVADELATRAKAWTTRIDGSLVS